jgi:hypothetical protein
MSVEFDKEKCKIITLDTILDINNPFDNGHSKTSISRTLGLNEPPVRLILSRSNEYTEQGRFASTSPTIQCPNNRSSIAVEMDYLSITWLEDCNQKWSLIGTNSIMTRYGLDERAVRFRVLIR